MSRATFFVLFMGLLASACGIHRVALQAPDSTAPVEQRVAAFDALRPAGKRTVVHHSTDAQGRLSTSTSTSLVLANGRAIYDPRDFLAVVPPSSATSRHVMRYDSARESASRQMRYGFGVSGGGAAVGVIGLALDSPLVATIGALAMLGGAVYAWIGPLAPAVRSNRERDLAFEAYESDLLEYLALQPTDLAPTRVVHDRQGGAPSAAPPIETAPPGSVIKDKRAP